MKKLILLISFVFCFVFSFAQPVSNRSNASVTVQDARWMAQRNAFLPRYADTTEANTYIGIDSCGAIIYTYDADGFWIRECSPSKHWGMIQNGSTSILPNCGLRNGTGIVTWDSLLHFDITAALYALCCDMITRTTSDTTIILPDGDPDNPRIDAIILDQNGVNQIQGIPAANPALPQTDSCQIVLTYVLIAAGQTEPQNIVQAVIYDENDYDNDEWVNDSLSQITMDTANMGHPVHLIHDDSVISYTTGGYMIWTAPENIHLNNFSALKLYVRKTFNSVVRLDFTFYLDGQQATNQLFQSIPATGTGFYTTIVIPIANFQILNTDEVNKLKIILTGAGQPIYIDWIQLQGGLAPPPNITNGITSISTGSNNIILPNVTNPNGPNAQINIPLRNQSPYTIFRQNSSIDSTPVFGKLDLSQTQYFINTLPVNLLTGGTDGQYLTTVVNTPTWTTPSQDTTFVGNWLVRRPDPNSNNDTLLLGYSMIDTALLRFDTTYLGLNGHILNINNGFSKDFLVLDATSGQETSWIEATNGTGYSSATVGANTNTGYYFELLANNGSPTNVRLLGDADNETIIIDKARFEQAMSTAVAAANDLTLSSIGNVFSVTGNTQINAITTTNWQAGSQVELIFTGTPTVKNNTAGGAGTATILLAGSVDFTAAANDVLSLVYDGTNWHETARKTASGATTQTLQQTFNTEVGGSVLTKLDSIQAGSFGIRISNSDATNSTLNLVNGGAAYVLIMNGTNGINVTASDNGVVSTTTNRSAFTGTTSATNPADFIINASATNTVLQNLDLQRTTTGSAGNGIGESIDFTIKTSSSNRIVNQLISTLTDVTDATRTSQAKLTGVLSASTVDLMTWNADGSVQWRPITATAASAITPAEGMVVMVSSTNGTFTSIGFWGYQNGAWHAF